MRSLAPWIPVMAPAAIAVAILARLAWRDIQERRATKLEAEHNTRMNQIREWEGR